MFRCMVKYRNVLFPDKLLSHMVLPLNRAKHGMILSILSISSHGFALDFPKDLVPIEGVFFVYKLMIIP